MRFWFPWIFVIYRNFGASFPKRCICFCIFKSRKIPYVYIFSISFAFELLFRMARIMIGHIYVCLPHSIYICNRKFIFTYFAWNKYIFAYFAWDKCNKFIFAYFAWDLEPNYRSKTCLLKPVFPLFSGRYNFDFTNAVLILKKKT